MTHAPSLLPCTVVIRARNAEGDLSSLLPALRSQTGVDLSIVIVDNDSTDSTVSLARSFDAEVVPIPRSEFSWGRALNRGLTRVRTPVALVLSADALPLSHNWAQELTAAATGGNVAAAFGRQVPRGHAPLDEWVRINRYFPTASATWTPADVSAGRVAGLIASNSCAAISMDAWRQVRFDENSLGAEERPWVAEVLQLGYLVRYVSSPAVAHSHRDSAVRQARRLWELHVQSKRREGQSVKPLEALRAGAAFARNRLRNCLVRGAGWGRRLEGLATLPWEAAVLMWIAGHASFSNTHDSLHDRW